ncbi:hypothetical protein COV19_07525 [Candidatus Woesearchaeota archaeon CG10_big_fil_rev_8_21_14_0_10_44_13]|nr:MAG: hypothetical protein COV19_07525 [Candidatus Woesearchaeota archaeon CG10_big_fil_rev_8_21_14_0_10_44_13]
MKMIENIYHTLLKEYSSQGWWPIISNKTLLCEYGLKAPRDEAERWEIIADCILTQNTQWYPNVVRAIQQLKLGRPFTKKELEVIKKAEILKAKISGKPQKITKPNILTQNTSWKNVEKAIGNLNKAKLLDIDKIMKTPVKKIAKLIRPAGYYNQKADRLKIVADYFSKHFKNKTIPSRDELLNVKGIGPETADSIFLYAFEQPYFVIDAYTKRIFSRLGFFKEDEKYEKVQKLFMGAFKDVKGKKKIEIFKEYHALIVELAKRNCRKKAACNNCIVTKICKKNRMIGKD